MLAALFGLDNSGIKMRPEFLPWWTMNIRDIIRWRAGRRREDTPEGYSEPPPSHNQPANTNVWYLLATMPSEPSAWSITSGRTNRVAWNRFMSSWLTKSQRAKLLDTGRYAATELTP